MIGSPLKCGSFSWPERVPNQRIRQQVWIKEQKRGKRQEVVINDSITETFEEYLAAYPEITGDLAKRRGTRFLAIIAFLGQLIFDSSFEPLTRGYSTNS